MAKLLFYDVEALRNIFTIAFYKEPDGDRYPNGHIDMYYISSIMIIDFDTITQRIYLRNGNFRGTVAYHDLRDYNEGRHFASMFGGLDAERRRIYDIGPFPTDIQIQTYNNKSDNKYPLFYLCGYNSYNYDTTIIAYMMAMMFPLASDENMVNVGYGVEQSPIRDQISTLLTPQALRNFNNKMFEDKAHMSNALRQNRVANTIRRTMISSGRHLDIGRLNEKQSKIGLKRLLGTLGYQILESDKLSNTTDVLKDFDEVCELMAYNVSDIVNLAHLAHHKVYESNLELKQGLLDSYPEIVIDNYSKDMIMTEDTPLRSDRKMADSSSSQLASMALCPHGHLPDKPEVSFMYPSPEKALEQNRLPENILQITNDWFCGHFQDPESEPRQYWTRVYNFYNYISGKNFNDVIDDRSYPMPRNTICMPYFDKNGNATSCYVTFSVGGIHGAEYNKPLYDAHMKKYQDFMAEVDRLKYEASLYSITFTQSTSSKTGKNVLKYSTPVYIGVPTTHDEEEQARIINKLKVVTIDGVEYQAADYVNGSGKWKATKEPQLFTAYNDTIPGFEEDHTKFNCKKLNKKYTYTSYGNTQHEDFTSYYPNMLIQMEAFLNPELGYDRYEEIFGQKESLGKLMKDESIEKELRGKYSIKRNGTKLVLNSASGAGDAKFDNPIRVNNKIIAMRIIGQLFTWRIGQAQTFAGARVISTNTDGLYVIPMVPLTVEESNRILEEESRNIHVDIEPEPVYLVSKDSNNRLEYNVKKKKMIGAGGGALSCYGGPTPTQALSHPAVLDRALCDYLLEMCAPNDGTTALDAAMDKTIAYRILDSIRNDVNTSLVKRALYFQNMIAASPSTNSYNFYYKNDVASASPSDIVAMMQHYNRVFYVKKSDTTVHIQRIHIRKATGLAAGQRPPHVRQDMLDWYCAATGEKPQDVDSFCVNNYKEIAISKITGVNPEINVLIENHDLYQLSDIGLQSLMDSLDMNVYLDLLESAYSNWRNPTPDCEFEQGDDVDDSEDAD